MTEAVANLLKILDLEHVQVDTYRGSGSGGTRRRIFGGHVAAQAVVAAGRSTKGVPLHSMHLYFLRPGDPNAEIEYSVERLRDGRSFATRLVRATQHDRVIFHASASFCTPEHAGFEHQISAPAVPPPAACKSWDDWVGPRLAEMPDEARLQFQRERPVELRPVHPVDARDPQPDGTQQQFWCRVLGELGEDPLLHQAVATYTSDHALLSSVLRPHGRTFMSRGVMAASLDHTIWFHRPFRADQWLLYAQTAPVAHGGRGLAFGHYFDQAGTLVASMAQEGVLRQR
jgi:acyl-CoA thioesterase-2